ncbi:MAG: hypothetical protein CMP45_08145 [Rickettsiales bacterium]|nr:hypothetical protein [Rickettsiales bacterium]
MSKENFINHNYSAFDEKLNIKQLRIKKKISEIERVASKEIVLSTKSNNFKHNASITNARLSRTQLANIKAQNRKNFLNFLIALSFFVFIFYLLLVVL